MEHEKKRRKNRKENTTENIKKKNQSIEEINK